MHQHRNLNPTSSNKSTHFRVINNRNCADDEPGSGSHDAPAMTYDKIDQSLVGVACAITGYSTTRFAGFSGIPQSTLQRIQSENTSPRADTIARMSAAVERFAATLPDPQRTDALAKWSRAVCATVGLPAPSETLDFSLLESVITQTRHELRHVWSDLPIDKLAQAIIGAYRELDAAKCDANRDTNN